MTVVSEIKRLNHEYKTHIIDFQKYRSSISGLMLHPDAEINFDGDIYHLIDSWFEIIEYCYLEDNWMKYALEIGSFLITGIESFPRKVQLPTNSDLINSHRNSL